MIRGIIRWRGRDYDFYVSIYGIVIGILWTAVVWLWAKKSC